MKKLLILFLLFASCSKETNNNVVNYSIITFKHENNDLGFYYLNKNCIKKSFAELGGIKFKTITQTRIN